MFNFLHKKNSPFTLQYYGKENDKIIIWPQHPIEAYYSFYYCPIKSYNVFGRTCYIINEKNENYIVYLNEQNKMIVWNFDELITKRR